MFARRRSHRLSSTLEQILRNPSALTLHFFYSPCTSWDSWVRTTTSFKLAIEIFSIRKTLISDHVDKLAFSLNKNFIDDVLFSHAHTLTGCPLDANSIKSFKGVNAWFVVIRPLCHEKLGWGWAWPFRGLWRFFYRMCQACMRSCSLDLLLVPGLWPPHPSTVSYCNILKGASQAPTREP